ncbi:hypothetical protein B0684_07315 [Thioalkalivibrio versutus]|nr:hypothetical protein B0684_07315 [Thioalkalivibrio versutus]
MKGLRCRQSVFIIQNGISPTSMGRPLSCPPLNVIPAKAQRRAGISSVSPFPTGEIPDHRYAVSGMTTRREPFRAMQPISAATGGVS